MDMRCCVVNWWLGLDFCIIINDWFLMHNMNHGFHFLVFHGGLVMNHWLWSINNLLLMDDWLLLDYSCCRHLGVMEHAFMDNRLNNLLMNDMSWLSDIGRLSDIGWLNNMSFLNNVSWLFIMMGHFSDSRLMVHVRSSFII